MEYFTNFYNKKFVKFYNDRVTYCTNKMPEKTIFLDDLKDVQRISQEIMSGSEDRVLFIDFSLNLSHTLR